MKEKRLFIIMIISIIITIGLGLYAFVLTNQKGDGKLYCSAATCHNCTEKNVIVIIAKMMNALVLRI